MLLPSASTMPSATPQFPLTGLNRVQPLSLRLAISYATLNLMRYRIIAQGLVRGAPGRAFPATLLAASGGALSWRTVGGDPYQHNLV